MEIDGATYHFTPKGICVLLVNYKHTLPPSYCPELVQYGSNTWIAGIAEEPLRQMIRDCESAGFRCRITCGYRSAESQKALADASDREEQGIGAAAYPGQSEHQTGLAVDIVCTGDTDWLGEHCWEYGFILRCPEGKHSVTHIAGEFWYFRYVGREVSMDMRDTGMCLEEYLGAV